MRVQAIRWTALLMAVILVLFFLAPAVANAAHKQNHCSGSECCLVCRVLAETFRRVRNLFAALFAVLLLLILISNEGIHAIACNQSIRVRTPVLNKVRLNN